MDMQASVFLCLHCMLTYCETCLLANLFKELLSLSQLQIPNGMAIITALFYLKAQKTSEVTIINLKKTATQLGISTCTASRVTCTKEGALFSREIKGNRHSKSHHKGQFDAWVKNHICF